MMSESEDRFEEWDDAFLGQVIQEVERSIPKPSSNPSQSHHLPPYPTTSSSTSHAPPYPPHQQRQHHHQQHDAISYSPPRELSQKIVDLDSVHSPRGPAKCTSSAAEPTFRRPDKDKDQEIERLKVRIAFS